MPSKQQIRVFFARVAIDPAYRARLENDPVGTFAERGITVDPADVPQDGVYLPSNDEILAKLEELTDRFQAMCFSVVRMFWR